MKKVILVTAFAIFLIAMNLGNNFVQASQPNFDSQIEKNDKTIELFNGQNLDGWYTFLKERGRDNDPKNVFTVNDGIIRISGEEWG